MSQAWLSADPSSSRQWRFPGGLLLAEEKEWSNRAPIAQARLPETLIIPLQQHIGHPARALVQAGDRVRKGQLIGLAQGEVSAAVHASSSGTVVAVEPRPVPHPSGLAAPCVVIATDGEETWDDPRPALADYRDLDPERLRARLNEAGIVGLGGAAFPTHVKLNPGAGHPIDTLVVNGAECEPYISCDDRLMRERPERVVAGIGILRHLLGAQRGLIGVEDNKPEAIAALRQALAASDQAAATRVVVIPTRYPSGGEKPLIRILTGREVPSGGLPAQIGVICQNVATVAAIAEAVLDGRPLISRIVTLSGRGIRRPQNLEARIGTPLAALLAQAGGLSGDAARLVLGGPMMGFSLEDLAVPVTKAVNCLLALTPEEAPDPGPALACIRCGACAEVCPANLLPQQLYWHARAGNLDRVRDYHLFDCIECGCCALVCPSHIPLVHYYRHAKAESRARDQERRAAEQARVRHEARQQRLARLERERQVKLRARQEALSRAKAGGAEGATRDPNKTAIEAARKRVAARPAARTARPDPAPAQAHREESAKPAATAKAPPTE